MVNSYSYLCALSLVEKSIAASVPAFDNVSVNFSEEHEQFMQRLFRKMKDDKYHTSAGTAVKVFLIAAVLLSIATTVIGVPRTKEYNITDYGIYSEYTVVGETSETPVDSIKIGYMPDGFEKVSETVSEYMIVYYYEYNNETISILKSDLRTPACFDSENNSVEIIHEDALEYVCYYNDDCNGYIFNNGKYIYSVQTTLDKSEAFKIIKHLK